MATWVERGSLEGWVEEALACLLFPALKHMPQGLAARLLGRQDQTARPSASQPACLFLSSWDPAPIPSEAWHQNAPSAAWQLCGELPRACWASWGGGVHGGGVGRRHPACLFIWLLFCGFQKVPAGL